MELDPLAAGALFCATYQTAAEAAAAVAVDAIATTIVLTVIQTEGYRFDRALNTCAKR
jgi:hypothetical protein